MKNFFWRVLLLCLIANPVKAQIYQPLNGGEKLYIHTDKNSYKAGETIWFKGYLQNTSQYDTAKLSRYIYVELIKDTVINRIKVKSDSTGFSGYITIQRDLSSGNYTMRGYTRAMSGMPQDFLFNKKISITEDPGFQTIIQEKQSTGKSLPSSSSESKEIEDFDLQFLPESGRYFTGIPSKIAFKVIGADGLSSEIKGEIFKKDGTLVSDFSTKHKGMGMIALMDPDSAGYYAEVLDKKGNKKRIDLPLPDKSGGMLSVSKSAGKIIVTAYMVNKKSDPEKYYIVISDGSKDYYSKVLDKPAEDILFNPSALPYGVNSVRISDINGKILAERLFFINNKQPLVAYISKGDVQYSNSSLVNINVCIKNDDSIPSPAEFSVSVTDSIEVPVFMDEENIVSYMNLSSNLKGYIEEPGFYFNNITPEKERLLDLLMMTQGWRYYHNEGNQASRELSQQISGSISGLFTKTPKNTTLMIVAPEIKFRQFFNMEEKNKFIINELDFKDSTSFIVGVAGRYGGQRYGISVDRELFPKYIATKEKATKKASVTASAETALKKAAPVINEDDVKMNRTLKEVRVETTRNERIIPKNNPSLFNESFSWSQIRQKEQLEEFRQMPVIDYIVYTFPGFTIVPTSSGRTIVSMRVTSMNDAISDNPYSPPAVFVDHVQWEAGDLDTYGLTVDDVENVAVLKGNSGLLYKSTSGVILLTLKKGGSLVNKKSPNILIFKPLGYQGKFDFYNPRFRVTGSRINVNSRTIYWNPSVKTDSNGTASFGFNKRDLNRALNLRIEGVLSNGIPFMKNIVLK